MWHHDFEGMGKRISIPSRTYVSVPCSIIHAGFWPAFVDEQWRGAYQLKPLPVWDCARRFTSGMYVPDQFQCVSFAASKILGAEQGGAILHDNAAADKWFRRMRFDGRTEDFDPLEDTFDLVGHHCIMIPSVAATLLVRLHHLPKHNADLPFYEYPDLSLHPAFK
jgi:dTDP-4-amino-4,6-dideoxygalactose transaminase